MMSKIMWMSSQLLLKRNLNVFYQSKYVPVSVVSLTLSRIYCSKAMKEISPVTSIEKNFKDKEFVVELNRNTSKKESSSNKKYVFAILGILLTLGGTYIVIEFGKPDDASGISLWKRYLMKLWQQIEDFTVFIQEPSREKLLPDPLMYPYYQPPYTLVLEFTDVLVHPDWTYKTGWRFKKRPGLDYLLENLVGFYEIVVFTAEPGMTIFPVIEALDPKNLISYKLVRDSTHFIDGHHVKNLDKLNRDLKKVIVIDWNSQSVQFHPDNHLNIPRWRGENEDEALIDLTSFLKTIALTEIDDVRDVLRFYKQYDEPLKEFRNKQKEYFDKKDQLPEKPRQSIKTVFDYIM
ncbi:unnamed protein product [Phaedon cochleariae]|uniref:Mitochondrial import inner membrane translocase subunit TIM50 n=1 Tax=Phaedon cochleariae TaxID=80249 RepID=A0A9P0DN68_PHACE|nr:unnamed protein product [Phaedon cochleariae]